MDMAGSPAVGGDGVDVRQVGLEVVQRGVPWGRGREGGAYDDVRPGKGFREVLATRERTFCAG